MYFKEIKSKIGCHSIFTTFSDIKCVKDTVKLLESDINCSNIFFELSPKIMEIGTQINKWDLFKLKSFCITKGKINKMKRQPTDWEKIFSNFVSTMD